LHSWREEEVGSKGKSAKDKPRTTARGVARPRLVDGTRQDDAFFRALTENAQDGVIVLGRDGAVRYESPFAERSLGRDPGERLGESAFDFVHPDDVPMAAEAFAQLLRAPGEPVRMQVRLQHSDGSWRFVEGIGQSFLDDPAIEGIVVNLRDVTEQKQAEEVLKGERDKAQRYLDLAAVTFVALDADAKVTMINRKGCELLGYEESEVIGRDWFRTVLPEPIRDAVSPVFRQLMAGEIEPVEYYENSVLTKQGEERIIAWHNTVILDQAGDIAGTLSSGEDITEQRQAEEQLRRSEEYHRSLLENAMEAIAIVNGDGTIQYESPSYRRILGRNPEDLVGVGSFDFIHPDDLPNVAQVFDELLQNPGGTVQAEVRSMHHDGSYRTLEVVGRNLLDDPVVRGIIANFRDITERKVAEEALRASEQRLDLTVKAADLGLWDRDIRTGQVVRNERAAEIYGFSLEEMQANVEWWESRIHPEDRPRVLESRNRHLEGTAPVYETEYRLLHRSGEWRWILSRGKVVEWDDQGNPARITGTLLDVTERKHAENLIRTQRDLGMSLSTAIGLHEGLRLCLDAALHISEMDCGGVYLVDRYSGALDLVWHKGLPPDFVAATSHFEADSANALVVMEGTPVYTNYQELGVPLDEAERRAALHAIAIVPVRHEDRVIACLNVASHSQIEVPASARDALEVIAAQIGSVIGRLRAQDELRESEQRYRLLAENVTDVIWTMDMDLHYTYISPSVKLLRGYSAEEAMLHTMEDVLAPASVEIALETLGERMEQKDLARPAVLELEMHRKDDSTLWTETTASFLLDGEGRPVGILGITRDVTERRQAEEERQRMEQQIQLAGRLAAVGELAAGVAHELNNPLAAVQGFAQLLASRKDLDDSVKNDVETIFKESKRASRITSNLLSFARRHKPEKSLISINEALAQSIDLHAYRMRVNNIELSTELDPGLPMTMADFHQMQQVFVNLITNAEQAMTETSGKGKLSVTTESAGDVIRITFSDDGPGIPEAVIGRIFNPFFTTKSVGKGTGLGLSISFGIVQQHDGRMYASSKPDEGTTFLIELPVVTEDQAAPADSDLNPMISGQDEDTASSTS
jgi:PAS domain S-box-containing protein